MVYTRIRTIWYIIISIIIIFIISQRYVYKDRHLTQSYAYAHYSEITNLSYILYPGLLFAKPTYITLNTGDTLLIPKNWWHWIRTEQETHAINFFCNRKDSIPAKPIIIDNLIEDHDIKIIKQAIHKYSNKSYVNWDNSSFASLKHFIPSSLTKLDYLLTVDGYIFNKNMDIKEEIKNI